MRILKVVFVRAGQWGVLKPADYDGWLAAITESLERMRTTDYQSGKEVPVCMVRVVADVAELKALLARGESFDRVCFISRSEIEIARKLKAERRDLRIVVLTGALMNDDDVPVVNKGWFDVAGWRNFVENW